MSELTMLDELKAVRRALEQIAADVRRYVHGPGTEPQPSQAEAGTPLLVSEMSGRLFGVLRRMGVTTWEQAVALDVQSLAEQKNAGTMTVREFELLLALRRTAQKRQTSIGLEADKPHDGPPTTVPSGPVVPWRE